MTVTPPDPAGSGRGRGADGPSAADSMDDSAVSGNESLVALVREMLEHVLSADSRNRIGSKLSSLMRPHTGTPLVSRMYFHLALAEGSALRARFVTDVLRETGELWMAKLLAPAARAAAEEGFRKKRLKALLEAEAPSRPLGSRAQIDIQLTPSGMTSMSASGSDSEKWDSSGVESRSDLWVQSLVSIIARTGSGVMRDVVVVHVSRDADRHALEEVINLSRILPIVLAVVFEDRAELLDYSSDVAEGACFKPNALTFYRDDAGNLSLVDVGGLPLLDVAPLVSFRASNIGEVIALATASSLLGLLANRSLKRESRAIVKSMRLETPNLLPLSKDSAAFHRLMHFRYAGVTASKERQRLCGELLEEGYYSEANALLASVPEERRNGYYHVRRLRLAFARADFETAAQGVPGDKISVSDARIRDESIAVLGVLDELESTPEGGVERVESVTGKVLTILHAVPPHQSGGYVVRAHNLLSTVSKNSLDVVAYARPGFPEIENDLAPGEVDAYSFEGVSYALVGAKHERKKAEYAYMRETVDYYKDAIRRERPAIVHLRSTYVSALPGLIAARHFGLPVVYEVSGLWELVYEASGTGRHEGKRARTVRLEDAVLANADRVVTLTSAMARIIQDRVDTRTAVEVVPNAVNSALFVSDRKSSLVLDSFAWPAGVPIIGYVGSFVDYEGLDLMIRAFGSLKEKGLEFRALMVGDGVKLREVQDLASELGLEDRVRFTGRIPHSAVAEHYSIIDICAFPRRLTPATEAVSPMKPFEAMASGKAVLVSDVPALVEIAGGGQRAGIFKQGSVESLASALEVVLRDPDRVAELRRRGQQWVREERDWEVVGSRFAATLTSLAMNGTNVQSVPGQVRP